jgi:hypothetical protein
MSKRGAFQECTVANVRAHGFGGNGMPTPQIRSAADYRERAKKLRIAAETVALAETRYQLLAGAEDYETLAKCLDQIDRPRAAD